MDYAAYYVSTISLSHDHNRHRHCDGCRRWRHDCIWQVLHLLQNEKNKQQRQQHQQKQIIIALTT